MLAEFPELCGVEQALIDRCVHQEDADRFIQLMRAYAARADIDAGTIVSGEKTVEQMGEAILDLVVRVASGEVKTKAELLGQDDFIPWKRGISL